jgi:hypothetical protein
MNNELWGEIFLKQVLRIQKGTKWEIGCDKVTWIDLSQDDIQCLT